MEGTSVVRMYRVEWIYEPVGNQVKPVVCTRAGVDVDRLGPERPRRSVPASVQSTRHGSVRTNVTIDLILILILICAKLGSLAVCLECPECCLMN